jgi:hypothetical protein
MFERATWSLESRSRIPDSPGHDEPILAFVISITRAQLFNCALRPAEERNSIGGSYGSVEMRVSLASVIDLVVDLFENKRQCRRRACRGRSPVGR